ncbi:unnamed protein product, partial [Choristocarpus tenellus]
IIKKVTVEDVDECSISPDSPQARCAGCMPVCHEHADCENRVGTYACRCPRCMSGDGFNKIIARRSSSSGFPEGYAGGTGCVDSCAPRISLLGDNPKVFRVCKCTDLSGAGLGAPRDYTGELTSLIKSTGGGVRVG